jgi:hypothetical protein
MSSTIIRTADKFDVVAPPLGPPLMRQPPPAQLGRITTTSLPADSVGRITHSLRHPIRSVVVDERRAPGLSGSKPFKGQMQHSLTQLLAQAATTRIWAEPGRQKLSVTFPRPAHTPGATPTPDPGCPCTRASGRRTATVPS